MRFLPINSQEAFRLFYFHLHIFVKYIYTNKYNYAFMNYTTYVLELYLKQNTDVINKYTFNK